MTLIELISGECEEITSPLEVSDFIMRFEPHLITNEMFLTLNNLIGRDETVFWTYNPYVREMYDTLVPIFSCNREMLIERKTRLSQEI